MKSVLVIMMLVNGNPVNHIQTIDRHGYLNHSVCMDIAYRFRKLWQKKAEVIYIGCPAPHNILEL